MTYEMYSGSPWLYSVGSSWCYIGHHRVYSLSQASVASDELPGASFRVLASYSRIRASFFRTSSARFLRSTSHLTTTNRTTAVTMNPPLCDGEGERRRHNPSSRPTTLWRFASIRALACCTQTEANGAQTLIAALEETDN